METQITKIKNGSIQLPKELRSSWKGSKVWMDAVGDTLVVKRLTRPSFGEMLKGFRSAGKGLSHKDIADAARWARSSH